MEFIDSTGHVFSLASYDKKPTGYEYETNKYIFWLDEEYNNRLSVNNYYIKCIRALIDMTNIEYDSFKISITSESNIFKLIPSTIIQNKLNSFDGITIDEVDFRDKLVYNSNDIKNAQISLIENITDYKYVPINYKTIQELTKSIKIYKFDNNTNSYIETSEYHDNESYYIKAVEPNVYTIIPFYVVANSPEEGTWSSNILINVDINATSHAIYNVTKTESKNIVIDETIPLYIQALQDDVMIELNYHGTSFGRNILISKDNLTWREWNKAIFILNEGETAYFKCDTNGVGFNTSNNKDNYYHFDIGGNFNVGGNIMSLMYDEFDSNLNIREPNSINYDDNQYAFQRLFIDNSGLISAAALILPSTDLSSYCYYYMFSGCENMKNPPLKLPSNRLVPYCYEGMFYNCKSMVTTPLIESAQISLDISSLNNMFAGCTNISTILLNVYNIINVEYGYTEAANWFSSAKPGNGKIVVNNDSAWINISYLKNLITPMGWEVEIVNGLNINTVMQYISIQTSYITSITYTKETSIVDWCAITVGGIFIDESEELIINGKNMGINLPKDIIKGLYQGNYFDSYIDESLYNEKIKEYLFNYMQIKGECGNFRSAINSLKWFGWGDKITISRLLKNDNKFVNQYLVDNFDISTDVPNSSKYFKNTPNVSLYVKGYDYTGEYNEQNFDNYFHGEGHPILKDLFKEVIEVKHDNMSFYKSYYDYTFNELGLKLACLRYYYKKYFLPIHLKIHSASINYKVYTNDIKFICEATTNITEDPYLVKDDNVWVNISDSDNVYFYNSEHYVDSNFNEFSHYEEIGKKYDNDLYYINDTCLTIPIEFLTRVKQNDGSYIYSKEGYYNTHIIIENSNGKTCFESHFAFTQNESGEMFVETKNNGKRINVNIEYKNLIIYPKFLMTTDKYDLTTWVDKSLTVHVCCNNTWFRKKIYPSFANTYIEMGKLSYNYSTKFNQLASINKSVGINGTVIFNSYINDPQFIIMDDINYVNDLKEDDLSSVMKKYINEINISSLHKYYNRILIYNLFKDGELVEYHESDKLYDMYSIFFEMNNNIVNQKIKLNSGIIDYDLYLMHEEYKEGSHAYWYVVFISKNPMILNDDYYNIYDKTINITHQKDINNTDHYLLKFYKASNKFLINRCIFEPVNGINHFSNDDIILARLSNDKLAFNYNMESKWEVIPYSLGMDDTSTVYANNNICIVSISPNKFNYVKGVYNIKVNYCVDDYKSHSFTKKCIFKVD